MFSDDQGTGGGFGLQSQGPHVSGGSRGVRTSFHVSVGRLRVTQKHMGLRSAKRGLGHIHVFQDLICFNAS